MELKKIIKDALGLVRCRLACVKSGKGVYIGSCVHFVNGKNVTLADDVQVRPGCDLFAGWQGVTIGARSDIGERNRIAGDVVIGEAVLFGPDNYICSEDHCFSDVRIPVLDQGSFSPKRMDIVIFVLVMDLGLDATVRLLGMCTLVGTVSWVLTQL